MSNLLNRILTGWRNWIWESADIKAMAQGRAAICAACPKIGMGLVSALINDDIKQIQGLKCTVCDCPLSGKLRSPEEKCPDNRWQAKTK